MSGPHIAAVTLAAYECQSTYFPQPPYPDSIVCPDSPVGAGAGVTIWDILSKVRVEAFCWGAGTAIGELPPYFMARAARLSGTALQSSVSGINIPDPQHRRTLLMLNRYVRCSTTRSGHTPATFCWIRILVVNCYQNKDSVRKFVERKQKMKIYFANNKDNVKKVKSGSSRFLNQIPT